MNLNWSHEKNVIRNDDRISHTIIMKNNDEFVGHISFFEYKNVDKHFFIPDSENYAIPHILYLQKIFIEPKYRNNKLSNNLFSYFNQLYNNYFKDIPVHYIFENPIAEYVLIKNIREGIFTSSIYNEEFVERNYNTEDSTLFNNLLQKIKS